MLKETGMARNLEAASDNEAVRAGPAGLDDQVKLLLTAIEGESVPARLLELATALQSALVEQRQRRTPN